MFSSAIYCIAASVPITVDAWPLRLMGHTMRWSVVLGLEISMLGTLLKLDADASLPKRLEPAFDGDAFDLRMDCVAGRDGELPTLRAPSRLERGNVGPCSGLSLATGVLFPLKEGDELVMVCSMRKIGLPRRRDSGGVCGVAGTNGGEDKGEELLCLGISGSDVVDRVDPGGETEDEVDFFPQEDIIAGVLGIPKATTLGALAPRKASLLSFAPCCPLAAASSVLLHSSAGRTLWILRMLAASATSMCKRPKLRVRSEASPMLSPSRVRALPRAF